jgi:hypothetical protein
MEIANCNHDSYYPDNYYYKITGGWMGIDSNLKEFYGTEMIIKKMQRIEIETT